MSPFFGATSPPFTWPRTDKYQGEQRTCLSYPLWLQWTPHAPVPPNWFFVVIRALGCSELRQRVYFLCGLVWLWLSVALNTGSSQGGWQALRTSPIRMNDDPPPPPVPTIVPQPWEKGGCRMQRPSIKVRQQSLWLRKGTVLFCGLLLCFYSSFILGLLFKFSKHWWYQFPFRGCRLQGSPLNTGPI